MRRARTVFIILAALVSAATAHSVAGQQAPAFPHEKHARLFPLCAGCHQGITTAGDARFPKRELCANCHDGKRAVAVKWVSATARATNLVAFDHVKHARDNSSAPLACEACHQSNGTTVRMSVAMPQAERCISCHVHAATTHLADAANCRTCHVPLARAERVTLEYASHFEKPASHKSADFLITHKVGAAKTGANCAICHMRESCTRCHLNAASVPAIVAIESAPRFASLVKDLPARYAMPASHSKDTWDVTHSVAARASAVSCANCHTQATCRTCHIGTGAARIIESLPAPAPSVKHRLTRVHPAGFALEHKAAAALDQPRCSGCHETTYCTKCHQGAARPVFHPANFVARHAAESFSAATQCSSCHNTEAFCKSCHQTTGIAARSAGATAFHDRKPLWLLQHGQAARQNLSTCTSCHRQADCTRCHADTGQRVSPHGADFDAQRMADRNRITCKICHIGDPLAKP